MTVHFDTDFFFFLKTVPFDTDVLLFLVSAPTSQPVGPHTAHGGPRLRFRGTVVCGIRFVGPQLQTPSKKATDRR